MGSIKKKRLDGFKFRRQHPLGIYILDFYCHSKKLGLELDGGYHDDKDQEFLDRKRTEQLNNQDIKIIRFRNEDVLNNLEKVLGRVRIALEVETPDP